MVFTVTFLFNILCALVPCDQINPHPTSATPPGKIDRRSFERSSDASVNNIASTSYEPPDPIVFTSSGALQGYFMNVVSGKQIYAFEGIPYALPPTGNNRFRAPVPIPLAWEGLRSAMIPGPLCLQMHLAKLSRVVGNENCLFLNVYSPQISSDDINPSLPVIIFLHGGAFTFGGGHEYGPAYLLQNDVVLVTINYRLGPLGFLSTGDEENPGNWGLKDQALAMQWIAENAAAFGGDPNKITLMGQSAGGTAVHLHMMSNSTKHLLNNAISLSASAFVPWAIHTRHQARKWADKLGRMMRCPTKGSSKALMDCFRSRNSNFIVANQINLYDFLGLPPVLFRPAIEPNLPGAFITESPEFLYANNEVANIPFLCTTVKEEAEIFVLILKGVGVYRLLLNHWRTAAPSIYDFKRLGGNITEVTHKIINFYLNGTDPKLAPTTVFSDIGTDRYFGMGIRKAIREHSKIAPTFSYMFGFKGPVGMAASFWGYNHQDFGSPHGEDLSYIFNSTTLWPSLGRRDRGFAISSLLVSLFANFASSSEPLYTNENGTKLHIWTQISDPSKIEFLQINHDIKMIPEPYPERVKFWKELNLNDSYAYDFA